MHRSEQHPLFDDLVGARVRPRRRTAIRRWNGRGIWRWNRPRWVACSHTQHAVIAMIALVDRVPDWRRCRAFGAVQAEFESERVLASADDRCRLSRCKGEKYPMEGKRKRRHAVRQPSPEGSSLGANVGHPVTSLPLRGYAAWAAVCKQLRNSNAALATSISIARDQISILEGSEVEALADSPLWVKTGP